MQSETVKRKLQRDAQRMDKELPNKTQREKKALTLAD
jgi:hypothetical protein